MLCGASIYKRLSRLECNALTESASNHSYGLRKISTPYNHTTTNAEVRWLNSSPTSHNIILFIFCKQKFPETEYYYYFIRGRYDPSGATEIVRRENIDDNMERLSLLRVRQWPRQTRHTVYMYISDFCILQVVDNQLRSSSRNPLQFRGLLQDLDICALLLYLMIHCLKQSTLDHVKNASSQDLSLW